MRGDQHTVNGLTAYILGTTQSNTEQNSLIEKSGWGTGGKTVNWGIRVWKRDSGGGETEITGGTPVAQVSRNAAGEGIQSNTWACPEISLATTDSIVVRVYAEIVGQVAWTVQATFTTEQLGAVVLSNVSWTVYYYVKYDTSTSLFGSYTKGWFYWGTSTYNSRIGNFTWTEPVVSVSVSDGVVAYGTLALNATNSTCALSDTQTVTNDGNVIENFNIKGQNSAAWSLASTAGSEQYVHRFSSSTCPVSTWVALTTSYQTLDTNKAVNATTTLNLEVTTPTATTNYTQQSVDVIIQAVQP